MINMTRQFWNEEQTQNSRNLLNRLSKEMDFVLIGGWAVFMYAKQQMSLDVDIALAYDRLEYFRRYGIEDYKNVRIKYSIIDGTYVDLFVEDFSDKDMPFPVKTILDNYLTIEGIKVVDRELLLILKLWRYFRADQQKIRKDMLDVIALLLYGDINLSRFKELVDLHKVPKGRSINVLLEYIDKMPQVQDFIDMNAGELKGRLHAYKQQLKSLFGV